jgi:hypothetical protein
MAALSPEVTPLPRPEPAMPLARNSSRALVQIGAVAAMTAGALRAVSAFLPADPTSTSLAVLYLVIDVGIVLGLIAWYFAQHAWVGAWGTAGFIVAVVGVEIIRSTAAIPGLALYPSGALLLVAGVDVLAVRAWRAGQLPTWVPGLLVFSSVIGPVGYLAPTLGMAFVVSGLTFAIGFAGLGAVVWRSSRQL